VVGLRGRRYPVYLVRDRYRAHLMVTCRCMYMIPALLLRIQTRHHFQYTPSCSSHPTFWLSLLFACRRKETWSG
jgi:hypothetical protein